MHLSVLEKPRLIEGHDIKLYSYNYCVDQDSADRLIERWYGENDCLQYIAQLIDLKESEWCKELTDTYSIPYIQELVSNGGFVRSDERISYKRDLRGIKISNWTLNTHQSEIHHTYFDYSTFDKCNFEFSGLRDMFFYHNSFNNSCFKNCNFRNGWFFEGVMCDATFQNCSFEDVVFNQNSMDKTGYKRIVFVNCKFKNCDLSRIDLRSCVFIGECEYSELKVDNNDLNSFKPIGGSIIEQVKIWDKEHWDERKHIKSITFPGKGKPIVNKLESGKIQPKSKNNIMLRLLYKGLIDFYEFAADKYDNQKGRSLFSRTHYVLSWLVDEKAAINNRAKMFVKYFLSRYVAGYGDRPETSIIAWLASVSVFAVLLGFSGIDNGNGPVTFLDQTSFSDIVSFGFTSMYFSVITATTVGYGDIGPANSMSMFLAAVNAIIGMFVFTTFTVVMVRRLFK